MSERESKFINVLTSVLASFIVALVVGMFTFYRMTILNHATQEVRISATEEKVETMRKEWREDMRVISEKLDRISLKQN